MALSYFFFSLSNAALIWGLTLKKSLEHIDHIGFAFCMVATTTTLFFVCKELDSLPCKIARKLVMAGQDKYMNNISVKNKNLKLIQSLAGCNLK